jgi:hypothetical protein
MQLVARILRGKNEKQPLYYCLHVSTVDSTNERELDHLGIRLDFEPAKETDERE